ncbi:MAG: hypothetical protein AAF570_29145, partial [Bacteroidota bacterium]
MSKLSSKTRQSNYNRIMEVLGDAAQLQDHSDGFNQLEALGVLRWIGRWRQLYDVPFGYLVGDKQLLPQESIRFFYLDLNWIDCLVDGAFSLGRASQLDTQLESAHQEAMVKGAHQAALRRRPALLGQNLKDSKDKEDFGDFPAGNPGVITGYILRSQAVSGWPGLQTEAYDKNGTELSIIRYSHLSNDITIALFDGELATASIHQPAEGLHFGLDKSSKTGTEVFSKGLRYTSGDNAGQQVPNVSVPVSFRDSDNSVVNFSQLVKGDGTNDGLAAALQKAQHTTV